MPTMTPVIPWVNDPPSPPAGYLAPLTEAARDHGWRCCSGCGDGFRCLSCGHYRHDTTPANGYRCGRCVDAAEFSDRCAMLNLDPVETERLLAYLASAVTTGTRIGTEEAA